MRNVLLLVLATALAAMSGCGTGSSSTEPLDATGTWGTEATRSPFLVLADGEFRGSDGCNQLRGTYEVDGEVVTFASQLHTMMACPGVDSWLSGLASARLDGDTLVVFDHEERRIGELPRTV